MLPQIAAFSLVLVSAFSQSQAASLNEIINDFSTMHSPSARILQKPDGSYELSLGESFCVSDDGNVFSNSSSCSKSTYVGRRITIPVKIDVKSRGLNLAFQVGGVNNLDARLGSFSDLDGKSLEDLFLPFEGRLGNLGIVVLGGGYNAAVNQKQVHFSQGHGSLIIGPYEGIGINAGVKLISYTLTLKPIGDATVTVYVDSATKPIHTTLQKAQPLRAFKGMRF